MIIVSSEIPAYRYLDYLQSAITEGKEFQYRNVRQLGARFSGKTVAGTIELIRAIIAAKKANRRFVAYVLRYRHKDAPKAWKEVISWLRHFKLPCRIQKGEGAIRVWGSLIYVRGCYTSNATEISFIGEQGNYRFSHGCVVFEEAREFDQKTVLAVIEGIRGVENMTYIYRSNPYVLGNWFVQECYRNQPLDENNLLTGSGDQLVIKGKEIYHYMRWDVNPHLTKDKKEYLEWVKTADPLNARVVYYGLPGAYEGMVFAHSVPKIKTEFAMKRWDEFVAGIDVGHVSSATAAGLWALEPTSLWKVAEFYHSNKEMQFLEAIDLANSILTFYQTQKERFQFQWLTAYVDSADPGFISLLNTEARKQNKLWFEAKPCTKIPIPHRISWFISVINKGMVGIHKGCKITLQELKMIAYDEKAEDDNVKLIKQNDHTWDSDMYALTKYMRRYSNYVTL